MKKFFLNLLVEYKNIHAQYKLNVHYNVSYFITTVLAVLIASLPLNLKPLIFILFRNCSFLLILKEIVHFIIANIILLYVNIRLICIFTIKILSHIKNSALFTTWLGLIVTIKDKAKDKAKEEVRAKLAEDNLHIDNIGISNSIFLRKLMKELKEDTLSLRKEVKETIEDILNRAGTGLDDIEFVLDNISDGNLNNDISKPSESNALLLFILTNVKKLLPIFKQILTIIKYCLFLKLALALIDWNNLPIPNNYENISLLASTSILSWLDLSMEAQTTPDFPDNKQLLENIKARSDNSSNQLPLNNIRNTSLSSEDKPWARLPEKAFKKPFPATVVDMLNKKLLPYPKQGDVRVEDVPQNW